MLKTGKIILLSFFILNVFTLARAADVTFNANVDKNIVALNDTVQYTLTISGNSAGEAPNPTLPKFVNLSVVGTSQSSNFSFINGQVSVSKSFIYTLQPEKIGTAHIGSASINIGGKIYTTQPIDIRVTKAEEKKAQPNSRQQTGIHRGFLSIWDDFDEFFKTPFPHFRRSDVVKDPIKVNLQASRNTAYVNEQIILTFTFYRRVNLFQSPSYTPPDTTGFLSINLPTEKNVREVTLNGIRYIAQDFKTALFPTTSGNFYIGPAIISVQTDPLGEIKTIKTNPLKIRVLPLPEKGKPADFSGAVGDYQMSVKLKQNEIERGQPVSIIVNVWGRGNIQTISEPLISLSDDFKKLSSTGKEDLIKEQNGVSGSKSFEIVLLPLKEGKFDLPPFEFSYFDPNKKEYRTLKSRGLSLNVLPSKIPLPQTYEKILTNENEKRQIKPIIVNWQKFTSSFFAVIISIYFWLPLFIIVCLVIIFVLHRKYKSRLIANPVKLRQKQALKVAEKRLKEASYLLRKNELKKFIGEIFNSVAKYLGDKYGFSSAGITTDGLREILKNKGLSSDVQNQIDNFILECDLLRFTPASLSKEKAIELAKVAEQLIITIEKLS